MIDLALLDKTKTNALLLRHAERDKMDIGQIEQRLNEAGIKNATILGAQLRGFVDYRFFSSPVDRCIQTVECLQMGIFGNREEKPNSHSDLLGRPGVFVVDRKNNAFRTSNCKDVVICQIAHKNLEGIRGSIEGTRILIDFVIEQMKLATPGSLLVFVTHDAIVAPVIFELTGEQFDHDHWPDYSDGIIVEQTASSPDSQYRVIRNSTYYNLIKHSIG